MSQDVRYTSSHPRQRSVPRLFHTAEKRSLLLYLIVCAVGITLGVATAVAAALTVEWVVVLIIAVMGTAFVAVFGNIKRMFLATIMLYIPLQLDAFLNYHEEAGIRGAIGGWIISLTTIALVGLYALWLIELTTRRPAARTKPKLGGRYALLPLLFIGFNIVSVVVAEDTLLSAFRIFQLLQMLLLYIYIANQIRTKEEVRFLITMMLIGLIVESLIMIVVRLAGTDFNLGFTNATIERSGRVNGTMGSPNAAGGYLSMVLAVTVSVLMMKGKLAIKWLAIAAVSLGMISLILTSSRGAWVAFALACMIIGFVALREGWLTPSVIIAAFVGLVLVAVMSEGIMARVLGNDQGAAESRVYLNQLAINMFREHPLLGVGTNNFTVVMYDYQTVELAYIWLYSVHNKYLLILSETGIGAFIAFVLFLLSTIWQGWKAAARGDPLLSPIALGLTAGIGGHIAHMLVDVFNRGPTVDLLWFSAGLLVAINFYLKQQESEKDSPVEELEGASA